MPHGTLQLGYGLRDNLPVMLRAGLASRESFGGPGFTIRHGGTDLELLAKWCPQTNARWAAEMGVSFPSAPAQDGVNLTALWLYSRALGDRLSLYLAPRAVFVEDNPIVGIGGGAYVRLTDTLEVIGDFTEIVAGDNTRSVYTGDKVRGEVWGAFVSTLRSRSPPAFIHAIAPARYRRLSSSSFAPY